MLLNYFVKLSHSFCKCEICFRFRSSTCLFQWIIFWDADAKDFQSNPNFILFWDLFYLYVVGKYTDVTVDLVQKKYLQICHSENKMKMWTILVLSNPLGFRIAQWLLILIVHNHIDDELYCCYTRGISWAKESVKYWFLFWNWNKDQVTIEVRFYDFVSFQDFYWLPNVVKIFFWDKMRIRSTILFKLMKPWLRIIFPKRIDELKSSPLVFF